MRKLPGLFTVFAGVAVLVTVNAASATPPSGQFSSTEYGRAQQVENGKVVASSNYDVQSSTYTVAPGGNTGWRSAPGTMALAVTKGTLKVEQAEGCAGRDVAAKTSVVLPPGQFRLLNSGQEPAELLVNFTDLPNGGGSPLDGPSGAAPSCAGFAAAAPNGVSAGKSFRGDVSAYFRQAHAGHGDQQGAYPTKELAVQAGKDTFMGTFSLQPGFSTGWFTHTDHVAILTKGTWAFFEARDGKCEKVEEYRAGEAWVHSVHRHLGAVQGNETAEITLFGFNMRHGDPFPVFDSNPDHFDFSHSPPADCPTQLR